MTHTYYGFEKPVTRFDFDNHSDFLIAKKILGDKIRVFQGKDYKYSINDETSFIVPNEIVENIMADISEMEFEVKEVNEYRVID